MSDDTLHFEKDRVLILRSVYEPIENIKTVIRVPFAAMLSAGNDTEQSVANGIVGVLVDYGCIEFCCVGRQAEELHDAIDGIIEEKNALDVVTTWHQDLADACEYFLYTAGSAPKCLLALVEGKDEIVGVIRNLVSGRAAGGTVS